MNKVGPLELATTAFGQGVSVTAIQQVQSVSTIVNSGTMMQPFIVKSISEPETSIIIEEYKYQIKKNKVKKELINTYENITIKSK